VDFGSIKDVGELGPHLQARPLLGAKHRTERNVVAVAPLLPVFFVISGSGPELSRWWIDPAFGLSTSALVGSKQWQLRSCRNSGCPATRSTKSLTVGWIAYPPVNSREFSPLFAIGTMIGKPLPYRGTAPKVRSCGSYDSTLLPASFEFPPNVNRKG